MKRIYIYSTPGIVQLEKTIAATLFITAFTLSTLLSPGYSQENKRQATKQGNNSQATKQGNNSQATKQGNNSQATKQGNNSQATKQGNNSQAIKQENMSPVIKALSMNPKINRPDKCLKNFKEGKSKTRIIVNTRDPMGDFNAQMQKGHVGARQNFKNKNVRRQLKNDVVGAQDIVINSMDVGNVSVTNRFTYTFGFSAEVTSQGLQDLANDPNVLSIDEDTILHAHMNQGIPLINGLAIRGTYHGDGLSIAICDTGIDYTHPMLGGSGLATNTKVIGGRDTGEDDDDPMDGNGHGTACAGIAAGDSGTVGDYIGGVAYNAKLYALKMTSTSKNGSAFTSDMVEAWEWCIAHQNDDPANPIMIISTSFGGDRYFDQNSCDLVSAAMTTAAANAKLAGITLFVSSGNDGYCDSMGWPGCLTDVISVGAVYDAPFGTYLPCVTEESCASSTETRGCATGWYATDNTAGDMVTSYSNSAPFLDLLAPSNQTYTLGLSGGYNTSFGGTSAACPYAAGAGAVLQSAAKAINGSYLSPDALESNLAGNGVDVTDSKVAITKPRVNLGNSITALGGSGPVVDFSSATYSGAEDGGPVTVTVNLDAISSNTVTVDYASDDNGTATAGSDYTSVTGTLTFIAGETSKTFTVTPINDIIVECNEAVTLTLSNPTDALLGNNHHATLTINGDDSICSSPNVAIPDSNINGITDSLVVSDSAILTDLNVYVNATHTWVGDLIFVLTHETTGTSVTIIDRSGSPSSSFGCSGDNIDAILDDEAASPVESECSAGTPTINGTFTPNNPLSAFDGEDLSGTWTLTVSDNASPDPGTLVSWGLVPTLVPRVSVWVDFNYSGTDLGTESQPYNTLAEAVNAVAEGGEVIIKGGITNEILTIDKKVTIKTVDKTTTILGQQ